MFERITEILRCQLLQVSSCFSHVILEEASLALPGVQNHTVVKNLASEVRQPLDQILVPSGNT